MHIEFTRISDPSEKVTLDTDRTCASCQHCLDRSWCYNPKVQQWSPIEGWSERRLCSYARNCSRGGNKDGKCGLNGDFWEARPPAVPFLKNHWDALLFVGAAVLIVSVLFIRQHGG